MSRVPTSIRTIPLPTGEAVPVLGQGTWQMAEGRRARRDEIAALQCGIDLGMTLIDTAEMYGAGAAEELVAEAIEGRRADVFLVSKVLPTNASRAGVVAACERSLQRLGTDRLDLYLLHWRGSVPLHETLAGFEVLQKAGKIRHWGVSNFDRSDMDELAAAAGDGVASNQVLYNLMRRGIEFNLLPWCRAHRLPVMAYSPIEQGVLLRKPALKRIAERHGTSPAQIALAWVLQQPGVIAIPKAGDVAHVRENRAALDVHFTKDDLVELDRAFPPPRGPVPLEMI